MSKTVRVTLELDGRVVRLLNAHCRLRNLIAPLDKQAEMDVGGLIAMQVCLEAMGIKEAEQWALVPPKWRDIAPEVLHDHRLVTESPDA